MKDFNPFKMIGSYMGLLGGLLLSYLSLRYFWYDFIDIKIAFERSVCGGVETCINMYINVQQLIPMQYILYASLGFLLGWGIHSLIKINITKGER